MKDAISKFFCRAMDILFVSNPKNTSLGVLFGVIVKQVSDLIFNALNIIIRLSYILCISLGVFSFNIPSLFRKHKVDESLEAAMYYISKAQNNGKFSAKEKREQWRDFVNLVNERTQTELTKEVSVSE